MDPVRCPYGNLRCSSHPTYGIRTGPVRNPQGCRAAPLRARKGIDTTLICKNPTRASYVAVRAPHGLFTGCLSFLNPYGARKLIMHALKTLRAPYGKAKFVRRRTDPVSGRTIFAQNRPGTTREQPGNNPYGARECDVTGTLSSVKWTQDPMITS